MMAAGKDVSRDFNPTFSATVGSISSLPHNCQFCHKQYATNAKLLQHQRKEHQGQPSPNKPVGGVSGNPVASGSSGLLVTVSEQDIGHLIQHAQPGSSNSQQPPQPVWETRPGESANAEQPGTANLAYRGVDGELLQLTRVPQSEAMRLVHSGATVIHVSDPPNDNPDPEPQRDPLDSSLHLPAQDHQRLIYGRNDSVRNMSENPTPRNNDNNYVLPDELVQVFVNNHPGGDGPDLGPSNQSQGQHEQNHDDENWINAYRRHQS